MGSAYSAMSWCNVCEAKREPEDLEENFRGMLECPGCGTELAKNSAHGGEVKRDRHTSKQ